MTHKIDVQGTIIYIKNIKDPSFISNSFFFLHDTCNRLKDMLHPCCDGECTGTDTKDATVWSREK